MKPPHLAATPAIPRIISGIAAGLLSRRTIEALIARVRWQPGARMSAAESEERAAFRAMLMTEVSALRQVIKQEEADKEALRQRLNTAVAQTLILRATVEMMEKRIAFSQHRRSDSGLT